MRVNCSVKELQNYIFYLLKKFILSIPAVEIEDKLYIDRDLLFDKSIELLNQIGRDFDESDSKKT